MQKHIHIAIPLLDELENLESLFDNLKQQSKQDFSVYFCINQPDEWWDDENKISICQRNQKSINYIELQKTNCNFPIIIIDKSSKGQGWQGKKLGVGWARKTLFDFISTIAKDSDIIISLDGDTSFNANYFKTVNTHFTNNKQTNVISVPYYHPLGNDDNANRAILRYEIYMRYYLLNLIRIQSPYAFSALGSAIAFRHSAMKKIGGFSPKKSGEDFYFLQKIVKHKPIGNWLKEKVFPQARFSDRVFFGTGPAMIKGNAGNWDSYPIYPMALFDKIKEFYSIIPKLYSENCDTPIDNIWNSDKDKIKLLEKLRSNNKDLPHFVKAMHDYFDGLRILQFLKSNHTTKNDEEELIHFLKSDYVQKISINNITNFSYNNSTTAQLNEIRDYLCKIEDKKRQQISEIKNGQ